MMRKNFFLLSLGATLEYYDFAIYIFFARGIGQSLIPIQDATANIIASFAVLAIGALVRPIGGIIFSHFGDTRGRKNVFISTILLMATPTLLIGLIPDYSRIGIAATILLVLLRAIQGFAIGGELPGSIVFAYEMSQPGSKALNTNIVVAGTNFGFLFASIISSILLNHQINGLAVWRIAFILGGLFGIISYFLRKNLLETPEFAKYQYFIDHQPQLPFKKLLTEHKIPMLQMIAFGALVATAVTVYGFFMPTFLATYYHYPLRKLLEYNSYSISIFILSALIAGKYDKLFGRRFFIVSILLFILASFYLFTHYSQLTWQQIVDYHLLMLFYIGIISGRLPVLIANFFPVQVRYSGVALSYNICFGVIAGLTQMILFALLKFYGILWLPAVYISLFALIALASFVSIPATKLTRYQ